MPSVYAVGDVTDRLALTPIAIPTAVGDLTRFEASAASPDGEGYWVAALQP